MSSVSIAGDTSGSILLQAPAVAGATTITFAAQSGTLNVGGPAFSVYCSGAQSLPINATKAAFDTKEFDTASCFNTSTYRFTPNVAGYYQIVLSVSFATTTTTTPAQGAIWKNGAYYKWTSSTPATSTSYPVANATALVYLNGSTDYVEGYFFNNTASTQTSFANSGYTYMQGVLVRTA